MWEKNDEYRPVCVWCGEMNEQNAGIESLYTEQQTITIGRRILAN